MHNERQWNDFVQSRQRGWSTCPFRDDLIAEANGREDIASVIYAYLDADYHRWLSTPSDLLDGATPKECLATGAGIQTLQELLMRMD